MATIVIVECGSPDSEDIMAKLSELAKQLGTLNERVQKIHDEVKKLKDSLSDVDLPAEAQTALDNLDTALSGLDELNPDATPPEQRKR
jgi:predicted nuclease with TOPRIM domain